MKSEKSWLSTLLLCFFLGGLGIHSFYAGKTVFGVIQLLTGGGCGIWWLIDFIIILVKKYKDGEGNVICEG
ncbi:MAG: TM2 domain-containing protein [Muribaculaceae bacterium]|nr:TM2 domain-containing protein [Muribaculaceae bacterium]